MDAGATIDAVRERTETERTRLGSDKALIAATDATLETEAVLAAAAARELGLAAVLDRWADEATAESVADQFETAADDATERGERIDADADDAGDVDGLVAHLETVEGSPARVGAGLVAAPLVADRFYLQVVNFFVNEADEQGADLFRDIRRKASALDHGEAALDSLSAKERETAATAATGAIEAAYADYAETLAAMGLDPKPVC